MTKQELRLFYKKKRLELTSNDLAERSERICEAIFRNFQLEKKKISLFLPIERLKEINTFIILKKAQNICSTIALPKMAQDNQSLLHYQFESVFQLKKNYLDIPEPQFGKVVKHDQLDFVFVPLLAIDSNGHRVGYGKGFYDRFLKTCRKDCIFIGLHIFDKLDEISDRDSHDTPMHYCITPDRIIKFE